MTPADRTCWETPPELFDRLDHVFRFSLDPCALPGTAKCARFFTPADDGLTLPPEPDVTTLDPSCLNLVGAFIDGKAVVA
jgi:hypothetical protein